MSDLDSMNREIKKRQLRRQIVPSPAPQEEDSEEIVRKARKRVKLKRLRIFLIIGVILIAAGIGLFQYFRYYQYTSCLLYTSMKVYKCIPIHSCGKKERIWEESLCQTENGRS